MYYLRLFETNADYQQFIDGDELLLPNVSLITETNTVSYIPQPKEVPYLTITALEDDLSVSLLLNTCYYSLNGIDWNELQANTPTPTINKGDSIYFKKNLDGGNKVGIFYTKKLFNLSGNVMSMIFGDNAQGKTDLTGYNNCFEGLFQNCTGLVSVSKNFLPAITLVSNCYANMFAGCTSLVNVPELPATTLAEYCYMGMFDNCTSLINAPELPVTNLTKGCYSSMFYNCTSLVNAPELPATTLTEGCYAFMFSHCTSLVNVPELPATELANSCYGSMFQDCTSLVTAPELPATTLTEGCYMSMFEGCELLETAPELPATILVYTCYTKMFSRCKKLNYIKAMFTTEPSKSYTSNWVSNVSPTGMFIMSPDATWNVTGNNGIPEGWTIINKEINLNNYLTIEALEDDLTVSLSNNEINYSIDNGLTWMKLQAGNTTPSINSGEKIYLKGNIEAYLYEPIGTFNISKKFNLSGNVMSIIFGDEADKHNSLIKYPHCFKKLFINTKIINVSKNILPSTELSQNCYQGMFQGCTSLVSAPELPATALSDSCYMGMFDNCTSLVNAPELPATTLTKGCYQGMFNGCKSLVSAPELPATTLTRDCYYNMFNGCKSLVSAPELPALELEYGCYDSMFNNCTSLVNAPELPATTLANYCYGFMFQGCTSLVSAPELPANALSDSCYHKMFQGCTSLNYIKMLATDISANGCFEYWVDNVSPTGTFVKSKDATWNESRAVPEGWTVETV